MLHFPKSYALLLKNPLRSSLFTLELININVMLFLKLLWLCDAERMLVCERVRAWTRACTDYIIFTLLSLVEIIFYSYNSSSSLIPSIYYLMLQFLHIWVAPGPNLNQEMQLALKF